MKIQTTNFYQKFIIWLHKHTRDLEIWLKNHITLLNEKINHETHLQNNFSELMDQIKQSRQNYPHTIFTYLFILLKNDVN